MEIIQIDRFETPEFIIEQNFDENNSDYLITKIVIKGTDIKIALHTDFNALTEEHIKIKEAEIIAKINKNK